MEDQQRLHRNRKLVLMVDLDQTLIHTTEQHCQQMSNKVSGPGNSSARLLGLRRPGAGAGAQGGLPKLVLTGSRQGSLTSWLTRAPGAGCTRRHVSRKVEGSGPGSSGSGGGQRAGGRGGKGGVVLAGSTSRWHLRECLRCWGWGCEWVPGSALRTADGAAATLQKFFRRINFSEKVKGRDGALLKCTLKLFPRFTSFLCVEPGGLLSGPVTGRLSVPVVPVPNGCPGLVPASASLTRRPRQRGHDQVSQFFAVEVDMQTSVPSCGRAWRQGPGTVVCCGGVAADLPWGSLDCLSLAS